MTGHRLWGEVRDAGEARMFDDLGQPTVALPSHLVAWPARRTDPSTSHTAARFVAPRAGTDRWRALTTLVREGPSTDFELAAATGRQQTSIGKRRKELVDAGLVEVATTVDDEGRTVEVTRPAPSGAPALVWQATPAGRLHIATEAGVSR